LGISDAQTLSARLFGFSKARRRKIGGDISEFLAADSRKQIPITREAALELGFQLDGSAGVLPLRLADPPVREHRVVVGAAPAHFRKVAARVRIHEVPQSLSPQDIGELLLLEVAHDERGLYIAAGAGVDAPVGEHHGAGEQAMAGTLLDRHRPGGQARVLELLFLYMARPGVVGAHPGHLDETRALGRKQLLPERPLVVLLGRAQVDLHAQRRALGLLGFQQGLDVGHDRVELVDAEGLLIGLAVEPAEGDVDAQLVPVLEELLGELGPHADRVGEEMEAPHLGLGQQVVHALEELAVDEGITHDGGQVHLAAAHRAVLVDDRLEEVELHHLLHALHLGVGAEDALGIADVGPLDVEGVRPGLGRRARTAHELVVEPGLAPGVLGRQPGIAAGPQNRPRRGF
jgi:hypothetical protein